MIVRFPRLIYEKNMKRRLLLILTWLFYFVQSTRTFALQQLYGDSSDVDNALDILSSNHRPYSHHDSYHIYPRLIKNLQAREAEKPGGLYGTYDDSLGRIDPDESQIDAASSLRRSFLGGSHGDDTIPPVAESASKSVTGQQSQPETVPVVVQKSSGDGQKESRAPQRVASNAMAQVSELDGRQNFKQNDAYFIGLVAGCSGAALFGVMAAGFCWYKLQKNAKAAAAADYPAYGVTGPSKEAEVTSPPNGDRKLAQNAQMFHYQHQKQQMIAIEKAASDRRASTSDLDSEEENEEGDYTVYECPGLAPTGEMEVKNPLFRDDPTPVSPPATSKDSEKHLQQ